LSSFIWNDDSKSYYYIDDFQRFVVFEDSVAVLEDSLTTTNLRINKVGNIECEIYRGDELLQSGVYKESYDLHSESILIPIPGFDNALMDSTIFYPIYKKTGNWLWNRTGLNITYFYGTELSRNDRIVHLEPLDRDVLLIDRKGDIFINKYQYVFRANANIDTIHYWKMGDYANWENGIYLLTNDFKTELHKAIQITNGYEIHVIDSTFKTPIFELQPLD